MAFPNIHNALEKLGGDNERLRLTGVVRKKTFVDIGEVGDFKYSYGEVGDFKYSYTSEKLVLTNNCG